MLYLFQLLQFIVLLANIYLMANVPKTRRTFCKGKQCRKHTLHKTTQYKRGKQRKTAQGKRCYVVKQQGNDGQKSQNDQEDCPTNVHIDISWHSNEQNFFSSVMKRRTERKLTLGKPRSLLLDPIQINDRIPSSAFTER